MAALLSQTALARSVEDRTYDLRVRYSAHPAAAASPVVIVEINESSVRALEPVVGRWPWPRLVHATAVDYLSRAGARVIAYDVLFSEREGRSTTVINGREIAGDDSDRAFADAVARAGSVVLLGNAIFSGLTRDTDGPYEPPDLPGARYQPGDGFQRRALFGLPFDELAAGAAAIGHNYLAKDEGSDFARRMLPFVDVSGVAVPSLGLAAALAFIGADAADVTTEGTFLRVGDRRMPLLDARTPDGTPSRQALLRFLRPVPSAEGASSTFPTYSFFDVVLSEDNVASGKPPAIAPETFAGKLVFIGTTAAGMHDRYATPFDGGAAGVELHATLADNLLAGAFMRRAPFAADLAAAALTGIVVGAGAAVLPVSLAVVLTACWIVGFAAWSTQQAGSGVWGALLMPMMAGALALFGGVTWRYLVEDRARRQVRRLFGRYVSNAVIEKLMDDPSLAALGGDRRDMPVLFSDIRGFTSTSERADPEAVVAQLNEYFGAMVDVLFRHQGTLDKFVGDMVMGLFGAPLADPRHADHAVGAALEMVSVLDRLNAKWRGEGRPELNIGIGINSGEMIAGNIGSEAIMSYTVIGDAVNLGSRLESLNKDFGTRILISDATKQKLTTPFALRPLGPVTVKGRRQPVEIYEVAGRLEDA